jgi:hypothetical protein
LDQETARRYEALLARVGAAFHEFNLLALRMDELEARFDSALVLHGLDLAANEDRIRGDSVEEDLVGGVVRTGPCVPDGSVPDAVTVASPAGTHEGPKTNDRPAQALEVAEGLGFRSSPKTDALSS